MTIKFKKDIAPSALYGSVTLYHVIVDGRNIGSVKRSGNGWVGSTALRHGETVMGRTRAAAAEELVRVCTPRRPPVAPAAVTVMPAGPTVSLLVAPANERMAGCRDGFRVYHAGAQVGLVAPLAFDSGPLPADARWRYQRPDGTGGTEQSRDAAALALVPADGWPFPFQREGCPHDPTDECTDCRRLRTAPIRGGALALILCILAMSSGACATQATRTADAYRALNETQLKASTSATKAMRNIGNDTCDCDNFVADDSACISFCAEPPCDAVAAPDVDVSGSNPGDDDDYVMTPAETQIYAYLTQSCAPRAKPDTAVVSRIEGQVAVLLVGRNGDIEQRVGLDVLPSGVKIGDTVPWTHNATPAERPPLTIHAASENEADAVEAAVLARKPLAPGAEVIQAACSVAWKVWDIGKTWRFVCDSTGTVITAPKSTADAGLTSTTVGNPSAEWVR